MTLGECLKTLTAALLTANVSGCATVNPTGVNSAICDELAAPINGLADSVLAEGTDRVVNDAVAVIAGFDAACQ